MRIFSWAKAGPIICKHDIATMSIAKKLPIMDFTCLSESWNGPQLFATESEGLAAAASSQVPSETPTWDQKGCQYIPHVMALDVNQHFKVTNSDQTSHNIHPMPKPGGPNHEWNKSQPIGAPPFDVSWQAQEVAIHVKCNVHPWMSGYMAVVKGPTGVSDDHGSYTLDQVPPGDYTLTAWQETYGTQTQKVTVGAGKPATADFTFKAK